MVKEGKTAGVRQSQVWTDSVIVGGSGPLQTAGAMVLIEASGTSASLSGQNIFATGSVTGGRVLAGANRLFSTGHGSPTVFGLFTQAGSIATSAASVAWAVFGTAFAAAPVYIHASAINSGGVDRAIGIASVTAGSFYAVSQGAASITFMWTAVGAP